MSPTPLPTAVPTERRPARPIIPRGLSVGVLGLMALALLLAALRPASDDGGRVLAADQIAAERSLRFVDRDDGSIGIVDADSDLVIDEVAPGANGFLRGTLRGLVRERKRQSIGAETAFRLVGRRDGHLLLNDPATGRTIDLGAFGPTNAETFARLLTPDTRAARAPATQESPRS